MMLTIAEQSIWLTNLLSPPILFFFLGLCAAAARVELEIPAPVTKFLSLYLLWAVGFKGGHELAQGGFTAAVVLSLACAVALAIVVPLMLFPVARRLVDAPTAAALCATYGSVSAVTFLSATTFLETVNIEFGGHMVAAMALMESPAIVIGVLLARRAGTPAPAASSVTSDGETVTGSSAPGHSTGAVLREAFLSGPVVILLGSLLIGAVSGTRGMSVMKPLSSDLFLPLLTFFLLDLGLLAGRRLGDLFRAGVGLIVFAVAAPIVNAALALLVSRLAGLSVGDGYLLTVLAASASYIAVPAAMRLAVPEARASIYVPMALTLTFPFNILLGLPLYLWAARAVLG